MAPSITPVSWCVCAACSPSPRGGSWSWTACRPHRWSRNKKETKNLVIDFCENGKITSLNLKNFFFLVFWKGVSKSVKPDRSSDWPIWVFNRHICICIYVCWHAPILTLLFYRIHNAEDVHLCFHFTLEFMFRFLIQVLYVWLFLFDSLSIVIHNKVHG